MKALVTVIGTFTIVLLSACQPDSLVRTAISEAQGNASEIQRVLDNYKDERVDVAGIWLPRIKWNERNIEMFGEERTANVLLVHHEPSVP